MCAKFQIILLRYSGCQMNKDTTQETLESYIGKILESVQKN